MEYPIAEIFLAPQGEGFNVGKLMHFVRLAGCTVGQRYPKERYELPLPELGPSNIDHLLHILPDYTNKCTLADGREFPCDTNYKLAYKTGYAKLKETLEKESEGCMEICLTGGEPLMHAASGVLVDLVNRLSEDGYSINLETSGTIPITRELEVLMEKIGHICISPKLGFREEYIEWGDEFKILIDVNFRYDMFPFLHKINPEKIFLQPINGEHTVNIANLNLCLALQKKLPDARISLQAHKFWGTR